VLGLRPAPEFEAWMAGHPKLPALAEAGSWQLT